MRGCGGAREESSNPGIQGPREPVSSHVRCFLRTQHRGLLAAVTARVCPWHGLQAPSCHVLLRGSWKPCLPQAALVESTLLKQQLTLLQLKKDLLSSIFGEDRATALLEQVENSVRDRDLLHNSLLRRKSKLQVSPPGRPPGPGAQPEDSAAPWGRVGERAALRSDLGSTRATV